jgi:hypothetical protein
MQDITQPRLVSGRACGGCEVCCIVPPIDKPEIQKSSGSACRHCANGGCDVYEARPQVCRSFYCAWRRTEQFPEDWRPDKSGIFAEIEINVAPPFRPLGFSLMLVGNPLKIVRQPDFIDFVAGNVRNNVAVFMGLPGPKGKQAVRLPLNTRELQDAIAAQSRTQVKSVLENMLRRLAAHECIPLVIMNKGHDVST